MTNRRAPWLMAVRIVVPLLVLSACAGQDGGDAVQACTASGGKWVADSRECEIDNKGWCDAHAGTFNACASPCRNAKGPVHACAAICVPVCALPKN
jgi:hypothetical protein